MRFLANENFPFPSVKLLRKAGFDILSVFELYPGISDFEVIEKAKAGELIILTLDKDYGEIILSMGRKNHRQCYSFGLKEKVLKYQVKFY